MDIDPRGGHNRLEFNTDFFKSWSPEMAYILGFIFADGAIEDVRKSSRTCYLAITSNDKPLLDQIKKEMNSAHKLYKRKPELVNYPDGKRYLSKGGYILRIGSKTIYNDLLRLGLTPRKSLTILFPTVPLKLLPFFLRGYFDGDGCLYLYRGRSPLVIFTSGSLQFLIGLSQILYKVLKIPPKNIFEQSTYFRLRYSPKPSKIILSYIYQHLDESPFLERKYLIYKKYLYLTKNQTSKNKQAQWDQSLS